MKVLTILGTRPELIRLSGIIKKLDLQADAHVLVHTGQNHQPALRDVFFEELQIRLPNYALDVHERSFGAQAGKMFAAVEQVLEKEKPDKVLVLGDTNSALCAIVAARMRIPVYHMEAGNRCFDSLVPEELNRRVIDSVATFNLPYTSMSRENLLREGFAPHRIWVSGNPIYEVLQHYESDIAARPIQTELHLQAGEYVLVTVHRAENVDDPVRLNAIFTALDSISRDLKMPVICSVHPRTRDRLSQSGISVTNPQVVLHGPFGFLDFVKLEQNACCVVTDSGTVQEECCLFKVPAVTIRQSTERPETVECGSNIVAGLDPAAIQRCVRLAAQSSRQWTIPEGYADPDVSQKIANFVIGGLTHV